MFLSFTINKKIDFGKKKDGRNWQVVNDGVMGGLSEGEAQLTDDSVVFKGNVSLDNNGGFSSLRSSSLTRFFSCSISDFAAAIKRSPS